MANTIGRGLYALLRLAAAIIGLIALGEGLVFAQGRTASISGTVRDVSGAVLPGAAITVKHTETGLTRAALSDSGGGFNVPSLPVGQYEVTASKEGFKLEVRNGIDLVVAQEAEVNLTLQVGNLEQRVTVTGDAP